MVQSQLQWYHIVGVAMFLWATYHHHVAHDIFANLRRGDKGEIEFLMCIEILLCKYIMCPYQNHECRFLCVIKMNAMEHFILALILAHIVNKIIFLSLT